MAELKYERWKIPFSINPTNPTAVLENLYDLMYDENGRIRFSRSESINGYNLKHDIICYYPALYDTGGKPVDSQFDNWSMYGIDIGLPKFDTRSNPKLFLDKDPNLISSSFLTSSGLKQDYILTGVSDNSSLVSIVTDLIEDKLRLFLPLQQKYFSLAKQKLGGITDNELLNTSGLVISDKDSALFPKDTREVIRSSTNFDEEANGSKPLIYFTDQYDPFKVVVDTDLEQNKKPDILLLNKDSVFDNTLQSKSMFGYTNICLSPETEAIRNLYTKAIGLDNSKLPSDWSGMNLFSNLSTDPFLRWVLKNTWVWIRCLFWADYVNPLSFEQDLNRNSDVVHSNIMVSGSADFNKYDIKAEPDEDAYKSEKTRAYLPQTSPGEDILSDTIMERSLGISHQEWIETPWKEKIDLLIETASNPGSIIGSLRTEVIDKFSSEEERKITPGGVAWFSYHELTPTPFFDTESRKKSGVDSNDEDIQYTTTDTFQTNADSYRLSPGKDIVPTLVPKEGNVYVDGRIFSPTIDELWIYIKKLVSGRSSDIPSTSIGIFDGIIPDKDSEPKAFGIEENNNPNKNLIEINDIYFWEKSNTTSTEQLRKKGDPIENIIVEKKEEGSLNKDYLKINNWVNTPNEILYNIYDTLSYLDKKIIGFKNRQNSPENSFLDRTIRKFTARLIQGEDLSRIGVPVSIYNEQREGFSGAIKSGSSITINNVNTNIDDTLWSIRKNPYSLRELEVYIKGLRFNLETFAEYVEANYTVYGGLGRKNNSLSYIDNEPKNSSAGSLYQLHKDYNGLVDKPNTVFDKNQSNNISENVVFDLNSETNAYYPNNDLNSTKAIPNSEYTTNNKLSKRGNSISTQDVYMAADGTWRYLFDTVSLPITTEEF